jgi:hypothetical protein
MQHSSAPKFSKVKIYIKKNEPISNSVTELEFNNCGIMITGGFLIVVIDDFNDEESSSETVGRIFNLNDLKGYKTIK